VLVLQLSFFEAKAGCGYWAVVSMTVTPRDDDDLTTDRIQPEKR
jgi:hypothetical protein